MNRRDCERCLKKHRCGLALLLIIVAVFSFSVGISERQKIHTYVSTNCLVKKSYLEECGTQTSKSGVRQCFQPKWLIEYIDYGKNEETIIANSVYWVKENAYAYSDQRSISDEFQTGEIYPCYHSPSNRLTEVQWRKPDFVKYIGFMICGIGSLLFFICLTYISCCRTCLKNDDRGNSSQNHPSHAVAVAAAVPEEEEDIPLTPPPPYMPSTAPLEEENIPITPPPPYVSPTSPLDEENIPSSPPPPYAP